MKKNRYGCADRNLVKSFKTLKKVINNSEILYFVSLQFDTRVKME